MYIYIYTVRIYVYIYALWASHCCVPVSFVISFSPLDK